MYYESMSCAALGLAVDGEGTLDSQPLGSSLGHGGSSSEEEREAAENTSNSRLPCCEFECSPTPTSVLLPE